MTLAMACSAGEIKGHDWPCAFSKLTLSDLHIRVVMDVEQVYQFFIAAPAVRLERVSEGTYTGSSTLTVTCTFDLTMTCSIEPTGVVPGDYSCSVNPAEISAPGGAATLTAELRNAQLGNLPAGKKSLVVARIKICVAPK
jgi:hypothetical protein